MIGAEASEILMHYIREQRDVDFTNASKKERLEKAYRDWATVHAISILNERPLSDAEETLEMVRLLYCSRSKLGSYSENGINPFEIAYDQIETILAMLQHPEE